MTTDVAYQHLPGDSNYLLTTSKQQGWAVERQTEKGFKSGNHTICRDRNTHPPHACSARRLLSYNADRSEQRSSRRCPPSRTKV